MNYASLLDSCNRQLALIQKQAADGWVSLQGKCAVLRKFSGYDDFQRKCKLRTITTWEDETYREIVRQLQITPELNCLLILLYSQKLKAIIGVLFHRYHDELLREDYWSIIIEQFTCILMRPEARDLSPAEVFKQTRNLSMVFVRRAMNRTQGEAFTAYAHVKRFDIERGYESTQYDRANFNEIMAYFKEHMKPEEYSALLLKGDHEFHRRGRKGCNNHPKRISRIERRAVQKARRLIRKFFPNGFSNSSLLGDDKWICIL